MNSVMYLAWRSLSSRRSSTVLTILTIAISVLLLLGVERMRTQAKQSFANTISGTDLIVGARAGQINLLLYAVFRLGNPTQNISWQSYQKIAADPKVAWTVPISLGDSHRGFRVLGTNSDYFKYYRHGSKQLLAFSQGGEFNDMFGAVVGAQVAKKLGYSLGQKIIIAHGISDQSFNRHKNSPFKIAGILAPTGTAVDHTVHVTLEAIEAIHRSGKPSANMSKQAQKEKYQPSQITAFLLGAHSKMKIFALQRQISTAKIEPLSAILPGIALQELWSIMSIAEQALFVVTVFVVIAGMLGMLSTLLISLQSRRREIAILRALGARATYIVALILTETVFLTGIGIIVGAALLYLLIGVFAPFVRSQYGLSLELSMFSNSELYMLLYVQLIAMIVGVIPAMSVYRQSLTDGITVRAY
ncbi:MAG: putative ABC transport system permease protein [Oceanospirillaceae bacterium]|jgi:putative ABC transport system permease protein